MKALYLFSIPLIIFTFLFSASFISEKNELGKAENYDSHKFQVVSERIRLAALYKSASTDKKKKKIISDAGACLQKSLTEKMFPCWYGTTWDFNGYTDKPQEGKIACGYFVSTLLKHSGFNLNRYKLAQKHSLAIVKTLSCGETVLSYYNSSAQDFIKKTKPVLKEGLHVVGLDNHVGFILKEDGELFFIHASYVNPIAVVKEKASTSIALNISRTFVITSITGNEFLMKKWLSLTALKTN